METTQWYVAVSGRTVGPVSTDLLLRGLENGRVPRDALVCALGDAEWQAVSAVPPFSHEIFGVRPPLPSAPPPPVDPFASARALAPRGGNGSSQPGAPSPVASEPPVERPSFDPTAAASARSASRPAPTRDDATNAGLPAYAEVAGSTAEQTPTESALPSFEVAGEGEEAAPAPGAAPPARTPQPEAAPPLSPAAVTPGPFGAPARAEPQAPTGDARGSIADVDVVFDALDDETQPRIFHWTKRMVDYFRDVSSLELPDERLLLATLPATPPASLVQEDAMWNLSLCLAFGSERLADAAAMAFFAAQQQRPEVAGVDWLARTLLSRGFMPSGIPAEAGERAIAILRRHCPAELRAELEKAVWD